MRVYVASSWRNQVQPDVVARLRAEGHDVYDFKNPHLGNNGFSWREIAPDWEQWTPEQFVEALSHPVAKQGYKCDMDALQCADACVLVMPCGRSAHLEAGYAIGAGKPVVILLSEGEPELMYKMARIALTLDEAVEILSNCCHYQCKGGWNVPTLSFCTHTSTA